MSSVYAFIDGYFLQRIYEEQMDLLFGEHGEIDLSKVRSSLVVDKLFYYDSLPEVPRKGETETQLQERKKNKVDQFENFNQLPLIHVRRGSHRRTDERTGQKEVDVLLTTDAMKFAYRGVITDAKIVTGDLDFRPLVESLVDQGTNVHIYCDKKSGSQELMNAADIQVSINMRLLYNWSDSKFQTTHQIPSGAQAQPQQGFVKKTKYKGEIEGKNFKLCMGDKGPKGFYILFEPENGSSLYYSHPKLQILKTYVDHDIGKIIWTSEEPNLDELGNRIPRAS